MSLYPWLMDAWAQFQGQLEADRLAHAMLLHGAAGTGKLALAEAMAARLVCTGADEFACGDCRSCALFASGAHPDWMRLAPPEDKHQITVVQVRELLAALALTTSFSPRKVALITPAEAMNRNAANALLKSLEEPPGDSVLILVSHDASSLPVTIRSRCQGIAVAQPPAGQAEEWLQGQAMAPALAHAALMAAGGSPCRALEFVQAGMVDSHRGLVQGLDALLEEPRSLSKLAGQLSDVEPETLWTWLSHCSADAFRGASTGQFPPWLNPRGSLAPDRLANLQRAADRNRMLSKTPVKQDLLLQEWLIEWARLAQR
ncbi:MAG TPA: DNA polymerase III subunit delta' [Xanthomonadales bacterium]|nr:DNA polymerase III subunit delta' [Xanthomonadales bacterium]